MKALLCKTWGGPETLVLEELPSPRPAAGEVVIDVKAAGVNFPDVLIIQNKYQLKPPLPFAPGGRARGRGQGSRRGRDRASSPATA